MQPWAWWVVLVLLAVGSILVIWFVRGRDATHHGVGPAERPGGTPNLEVVRPRTIDELERRVRVPIEDQGTEQPAQAPPGLGTDWEVEQRRVLKTRGIGN